jgi:hypothetical protein
VSRAGEPHARFDGEGLETEQPPPRQALTQPTSLPRTAVLLRRERTVSGIDGVCPGCVDQHIVAVLDVTDERVVRSPLLPESSCVQRE